MQGTGRGLAQPSCNPTLRLPGATLTFNERDIERLRGSQTDRPQPRHPASRAMTLDVSEALRNKLLDSGTQRDHGRSIRSSATIEEIGAAAATLMPRQSMLFKVQYADITAMKNDMRSARHATAAIMVA